MNLNDKIYVAGHNGLVGSSIIRELSRRGFTNLIFRTRKELDLTNQSAVQSFFFSEKPDYVILAAAKVGGIHANETYAAEFIYDNIMIEANIIHSAYKANVSRLLFLGSTCIYPKLADQPMKEESLLTDSLEPTNEPYAIAKIAGIKICESYNRQYKTDFRSVMPTNLYGPNDNFHAINSHVIPGLMSRFHSAKINNDSEMTIWGSGKPMREFLHVDDMANASLFVLGLEKENYQAITSPMCSHLNVGTGIDITIQKLSELMKKITEFKGDLIFDTSKPDGPLRKLSDVSRLNKMGWTSSIDLEDGLKKTYSWYLENFNKIKK